MDAQTLLESMSNEEQAQLRAFLNARHSIRKEVPGGADLTRDQRDFYDGLLSACGLKKYHQSVGVFFEDGGEPVWVMSEQLSDILNEGRVESVRARRAVAFTVLECLADDLRERGMPVLPSTLVRNGHTLRFALEQQFPGYLAAGMLAQVVSNSLVRSSAA